MQQPEVKGHVVFDMTFPHRWKTGTIVYADEIVTALRESGQYRITCLKGPTRSRRGGIWKIWNAIRSLLWTHVELPIKLIRLKADLLHSPCCVAPIICPCPVILTVHDVLYVTQPEHYPDKQFSLYARIFIGSAVRHARSIVTVSHYSRKEIESVYGLNDDRVRVTYHGVRPRYQAQPAAQLTAIREKYGLDRPFFLFVGIWQPRKNLPRLIDAFRLFCADSPQRYELILVGPPGGAETEVRQRLADPATAQCVRSLGYVPDQDMPSIYAAAELFVNPSLGEGFGIPIIEAMACGTPVITSRSTCLPEVAGEAALLFDPEDISDIARTMRLVLRPDIHEDLKQKGLQRAKLFTWENAAHETEKVYADALR
jgi:glycosyltransferase involved in cell wall biosynthesis